MVQATNLGDRHDSARRLGLLRPWLGRVLVQREVRAGPVVVLGVPVHEPASVSLVQHDHVVEQLPAERADESLRRRVLPRGSRCDHNLPEVDSGDAPAEGLAV